MNVVKIILGIIFLIDCIALTVVVLMQEGKQQGLGAIAGAAETYWGKNKGRSMEGGLQKETGNTLVTYKGVFYVTDKKFYRILPIMADIEL